MKEQPAGQPLTLRARISNRGDERYFFAIVTVVLAFIYVLVMNSGEYRQSPRALPFTLLMLLYAAGFWLPAFVTLAQGRALLYLVLQTAFALAITYLIGNAALAFGLIAPLIGIAIGLMPSLPAAAATVLLLLAASALTLSLIEGWASLREWLLFALPMTLFVVIYVVLYSRQSEAREQAQQLLAELEIAHAELADYAGQVEALTLAAERQRLARELHDTLAQGVAGLILQLEAASAHLEAGDAARAQTIVQQAMARARGALAGARQAIDDLRAGEAEEEDLGTRIRARAERFAAATGIPCRVELDPLPALPASLGNAILRAVAEGLANVAQHAQSGQAWIALRVADRALQLEIGDDGLGFDPAGDVPPGHYGLLGLRERARLAGGFASIHSQPGAGTIVRLTLPLPPHS